MFDVEDDPSQSDVEGEASREPEQRPEPRKESDEGELMLGTFHNGREYPEQLEFLKVIVDSGAA
eukprot:9625558-Heterocapsa_arctica.AAC.1